MIFKEPLPTDLHSATAQAHWGLEVKRCLKRGEVNQLAVMGALWAQEQGEEVNPDPQGWRLQAGRNSPRN